MKTCFVVSPIGDKDSDVRKRADDVFELIVEPALETFDFEVVRADKIIGSNQITDDIVHLIQDAELCIIDLTGANPNVFYECGRRHEAGKPFIQLIAAGERAPFDVAGIRTIPYETADARAVREVCDEIRQYVGKFERDGYGSQTGTSLATVAQWIERMDRKLDRVLGSRLNSGARPDPSLADDDGGLESLLQSPREGFMHAIANARLDLAVTYLPRLKQRYGIDQEFITAASLVAAGGYVDGARELAEILRGDAIDDLDPEMRAAVVSGYVRYHTHTGNESQALTDMAGAIELLANDPDHAPEERASYLNWLQMLHWGAGNFDEAERFAIKACDVFAKPAYKYNLSLIYERQGALDKAEQCVDDYMTSDESQGNGDHIAQAIDIYLARGRTDEARNMFTRLTEVAPAKARLKRMLDDDLKAALSSEGEQSDNKA
jgi:tetratricopeptide (TPR) repeat protein